MPNIAHTRMNAAARTMSTVGARLIDAAWQPRHVLHITVTPGTAGKGAAALRAEGLTARARDRNTVVIEY